MQEAPVRGGGPQTKSEVLMLLDFWLSVALQRRNFPSDDDDEQTDKMSILLRTPSWLSTAMARLIEDDGPLLPVHTPPTSPSTTPADISGTAQSAPPIRWMHVVETGQAGPSVYVPVQKLTVVSAAINSQQVATQTTTHQQTPR